MFDFLLKHGFMHLDSKDGGADTDQGKKDDQDTQDADGSKGDGDEPQHGLSEYQVGFLTNEGIDISKVGTDTEETVKAMNLLGAERDKLKQEIAKKEIADRVRKKLDKSTSGKQPTNVVDDEGKVDQKKVDALKGAAKTSKNITDNIQTLLDAGKIDADTAEMLLEEDKTKLQLAMNPPVSAADIEGMVKDGIKAGLQEILKGTGVGSDITGSNTQGQKDGFELEQVNAKESKDLKTFVEERNKAANEAHPLVR